MRRRALLVGGPLALLVVILVALAAIPALTDWTARRDTLAALAS